LTTGGVSVGDYDFVRPVALEQGFQQIFWKVKQKPGKPMLFAEYQRSSGDFCYLLGLPGNPAAVFVGMQIYASTLLQALQGQPKLPNWFSATLKQSVKSDSRERFLRMFAHFEQGQLWVENLSKQQSHMLSNLMSANCLIRIPENQVLSAGSTVQGLFL
jgi:molybdopterin molybdotransferase